MNGICILVVRHFSNLPIPKNMDDRISQRELITR